MKLIEHTSLVDLTNCYLIPLVGGQWVKKSDMLETNTSHSFRVYNSGTTTELHIFNK